MNSLVDTISDAVARLGPRMGGQIDEIVAELGGLALDTEDQLTVLATALAAMATRHHGRHKPVYLEAVRIWSLEISVGLSPPPARLSLPSGGGPVEDGADILIAGLDGLIEAMLQDGIGMQDRLVIELALFAQLMGQHDANAIHLTLAAVNDALAGAEYCAGRTVRVPLGGMVQPLARDACLASLAPRGVA